MKKVILYIDEIDLPLINVLSLIEKNGIKVDTKYLIN